MFKDFLLVEAVFYLRQGPLAGNVSVTCFLELKEVKRIR